MSRSTTATTAKYVRANFVRMLLKNLNFLTEGLTITLSPDIVSDPPLSHDVLRLRRIFFKLFAQTANMNINRPYITLILVTPHNIQ